MIDIYKNMYSKNNKQRLHLNPRINMMIKLINGLHPKKKKILDFGCHDGTFLSAIKNKSNDLYGIDASNFAVRKSKKRGIKVRRFFFQDTSRLPYQDNFFDIVVAGDIIEHIFDVDHFLEEIRRILDTKGFLILSTPNLASLARRFMLLFGMSPIMEVSVRDTDSVGHIRYFTFKTLKDLLIKNSFKIITTQSDVVNFSSVGKIRSQLLAKLFPTFGQSIIHLAEKS